MPLYGLKAGCTVSVPGKEPLMAFCYIILEFFKGRFMVCVDY